MHVGVVVDVFGYWECVACLCVGVCVWGVRRGRVLYVGVGMCSCGCV